MQNKLKIITISTLLFLSNNIFATDFYVSPTGNDTSGDGSASAPWKSISKARDHVRTITPLTEDVNIVLKNGRHELATPLDLTSQDSGRNNFKITYKAENSGQAIVSGGSIITGWSDTNNDGIWEAAVPAGSNSRQLYVNNSRAIRARSVNGSGWSRNATGYNTPSSASAWANPSDVELVFEFLWKMNRGGVKSISSNHATMNPSFWAGSAIGPFSIVTNTSGPSWVENALELLDSEGEFYLNKVSNTLYYKPKVNENLIGGYAVDVVLPRLEKLISGNGVAHVEFDGIQFSHATWLQPSGDIGYLAVQAGVTINEIDFINIEDAFDGVVETPGNVHFTHSEKVVFKNSTFKHLGGAGVGFGRGVKSSTVFNSTFEDISASAVVIGTAQDHHIEGETNIVRDNLIDNNSFQNVAVEFSDNPAIISLYAIRTVIANNTIIDVPYSAISTGWGWGRYDVEEWAFTGDNTGKAYNDAMQLSDTLVLNNDISGLMQVRHDGGGIYNLGVNMNSHIAGNVVTGGVFLNGAVYLDNGSRGFQVYENVSYNNSGARKDLHINVAGLPQNFHNIPDTGANANDWSGGNTTYKPSSATIIANAGVKTAATIRTVADIVAALPSVQPLPAGTIPPEFGLVVGKTASASVNATAAVNAIDANSTTFWYAGDGQTSGWWQVDMGSKVALSHVSFALGQVVNNELNYLRNNVTFTIQGSDDGITWTNLTFHSGGFNGSQTPLTTQHTTAQAINDLIIANSASAQFIRINIVDSNNQNFGILRAKITGSLALPVLSGTNFALAGTATQSSDAHGGVAMRAIDGNSDGNWNNGSVTHTNLGNESYLTIDLGAVKQLDTVRLWNRSDCCSNRLSNLHVFVSDVPFTGNTIADSQAQTNVLDKSFSGVVKSAADFEVNRTGRYVRVQLSASNEVLSLAEVEIYGTNGLSNLALAGSATQSTTAAGGLASRAIDDNTNGAWGGNSVTHTNLGSQSYLTVDLGSVKTIDTVKLFNRTDCCSNRLTNYHVFISDVALTGTTVAASQAQAGVLDKHQSGTAGAITDIAIGRTGRYVRVQLSNTDASSGENVLSLAEVQIMGF